MISEDDYDFDMIDPEIIADDEMMKSSETFREKPIKKTNATLVQKFAERQKTIREYRRLLASISERVMSDPQHNIHRLKQLLTILITSRDDPRIGSAFFTIQKLTILALNIIFLDIIPNYRIYKRGEQTTSKLKNETRHVLDFEHRLLQYYQEYLKRLKRVIGSVVDSRKQGDSDFYRTMLTTLEARQRLATIGCRCVSELISRHYDFNCRETLIDSAAKVLCSNQATNEMQQTIYDGLKILFRKDLMGETTLVLVKSMTMMIQNLRFRIRPLAMSVFKNIFYREIHENESKMIGKNRKSNNQPSRRDRKQTKKMKLLEKQLLETEATESQQVRQRHELNIHENLYAFYMKFMTILHETLLQPNGNDLDRWYRPLLPIALESIIHLALHSNEEFAYAWIRKLKSFLESVELAEKFQPYDKLIFMKNIYTLMSRIESTASSTTTNQFDFKHLYQVLYEFPIDGQDGQTFRLYLQCIHVMIIKSIRHHFLIDRLINFVYRFLSLATKLPSPQAIVLLYMARKCIQLHPQWPNLDDDDDDYNNNKHMNCKNWTLPKNVDGDTLINQNPMDGRRKSMQTILAIIRMLINESSDGYIRLYASCVQEDVWHKNRQFLNHQQQQSMMNKFIQKHQLDRNVCERLLSGNIEPLDLYEQLVEI
ncbi:Nucleolar complex protein 3 [Dermatophagoides farinae]|uniref:Nucleolar complex protein 3 n=1 Tax=Dermatophagoides farinae TaxID=6954 RepID=A0A922I0V0_DERFA|nr:Nucleolar complex protein 3 [Dermatophagoides farinae]